MTRAFDLIVIGSGSAAGSVASRCRAAGFKCTFTDPYPERRERELTKAGVEIFHGVARFAGTAQIAINDIVLKAARAIVVAAGARPADVNIPGREHLLTSDQFLEPAARPRRARSR